MGTYSNIKSNCAEEEGSLDMVPNQRRSHSYSIDIMSRQSNCIEPLEPRHCHTQSGRRGDVGHPKFGTHQVSYEAVATQIRVEYIVELV